MTCISTSDVWRQILDTLEIARDIVNGLEDKKAENIILLDLTSQGLKTDYTIADLFIICTGNSDRQIKALADNVREVVKILHEKLPSSVEGDTNSGWVLMDYGDIIVHIMTDEMRRYYDLEGLYRQANVLLSIQ
ncbi:MAG: iojap family protein [Chloroflexi bacterium OLB15]|nr:MAG: iojap family protein [Chloroflexi bacterium OLB15]